MSLKELTGKGKGDLVIYDPRFAEVQVPGLGEELTYLRDAAHVAEDEARVLKIRLGRVEYLEQLEALISFPCASNGLTKTTILACRERRNRLNCKCEALNRWADRYIL